MKRKLRVFIFILMTSPVGYFLIQRPAFSCTAFISSEEIFNFPYSFLTGNIPIDEVSCSNKKLPAGLELVNYTKAYSQDMTVNVPDSKITIEQTIYRIRGIIANSNDCKSLEKRLIVHFISFLPIIHSFEKNLPTINY